MAAFKLLSVFRGQSSVRMVGGTRFATAAIRSNCKVSSWPARTEATSPSSFVANRRNFTTLNCANALVKSSEVSSFRELVSAPVTALQGIGPKHESELAQLGLKTIEDMANYQYFHLAKSIVTLAEAEVAGGRLEGTKLNINNGVDKAYEQLSFRELCDQPVDAIQGISKEKGKMLEKLAVKTIADLASLKYFHWSHAIVTAAKFESDL